MSALQSDDTEVKRIDLVPFAEGVVLVELERVNVIAEVDKRVRAFRRDGG